MRNLRSVVVLLFIFAVLGTGWLTAAPATTVHAISWQGDHSSLTALSPSTIGGVTHGDLPLAARVAQAVISPAWSTILLSLGFGGALFELLHPGFGVAGAISLVSWVLFFAGHWLAGLAGWEVIVLFLLGLGLLTVEAMIPGYGIMGLGGIAAIIGSIVLAVDGTPAGLRSLFISLVIVAFLLIALIRQFGRGGLWKRIILSTQLSREEGYHSTPSSLHLLIGSEGKVLTPLRPSGMALIEGQRVNVMSVGEYMPMGTVITVLRVEAGNVIVGKDDGHKVTKS